MRRTYHIITFLLLVLLWSCTKVRYEDKYPLSDELIFLLPTDSNYIYRNNDSVISLMTLSFTDNYYFRDTWDRDDGGWGRTIQYDGDFETYIKYYSSDLFDISYNIFVDKTNLLQYDKLDITIESNTSGETSNIHIKMPLKDYRELGYDEPNIDFADSLIVNSVKLFDVYYVESDELLYYLQRDKGVVAFEFDGDFWFLDDL